ncbi:MAG: hypothetical protein ACREKL_06560 [Chthoniobacterales bacterium]
MRSGLRFVCAAAFLGAGLLGAAEKKDTLTPEEIKGAVVIDEVALPTPGEFFAAINKLDRPNWPQLMRKPGTLTTTNRAQTSLNLGTRVADGFIAVEAQDGQQVKNIGQDIIELAKGLGVSKSILGRGSSIGDFAENNDWNALKEELDATENEVKLQMAQQKDDELVILVTTGAWLRGLQTASGVVAANYKPETAQLLRQPAIVEYLIMRMDALPARIKSNELVGKVKSGLTEIKTTVAPATPPSADAVKALNQTTTKLVDAIGGQPAAGQ